MRKHCHKCGKELDSLLPFKCRHCGQYFCSDHYLPENHKCPDFKPRSWIKQPIIKIESETISEKEIKPIKKPKQEKTPYPKRFEMPSIGTKKLEKTKKAHNYYKIKKWFFRKKHSRSRLRVEDFAINLGIVIGLSFIFWMAYTNADALNSVVLWIFRLGAIIQLTLIILIIRSIYKILVNLKYGIRGLANGYKFISTIIFVLLCFWIYQNPSILVNPATQFNYETCNPFEINWNYNDGSSNSNNGGFWEDSNPTEPEYSIEELRDYALELINKDRADHGLDPVQLGDNLAAQKHAEDMLENTFLSHWGSDGLKPYMRYTKEGGRGAVAENCAYTGFYYYEPNAASIDVKSQIESHEYSMMYDDALSSWGHRDNIINKWHNKVNIGIAYDNTHLSYVQDFEDDYISWANPISYTNGILSMEGITSLGTVQSVAIYYDPTPLELTKSELLDFEHSGSYSMGEEAGYIIEPGYYYETVPYVNANKWSIGGSGSFSISANISPLLSKGSGVYTVVIWTKAGNEDVMLTTHSLFIS